MKGPTFVEAPLWTSCHINVSQTFISMFVYTYSDRCVGICYTLQLCIIYFKGFGASCITITLIGRQLLLYCVWQTTLYYMLYTVCDVTRIQSPGATSSQNAIWCHIKTQSILYHNSLIYRHNKYVQEKPMMVLASTQNYAFGMMFNLICNILMIRNKFNPKYRFIIIFLLLHSKRGCMDFTNSHMVSVYLDNTVVVKYIVVNIVIPLLYVIIYK